MGKTFTVILCALLLLVARAAAAAPEVMEIAPGVFAFVGGDGKTNSGFVVTDDGVVVIDTQGPRELALLLKEKISVVTDKPVKYVVNTHYHGDHTFGNQHFPGAAIISHEQTRKALIERDQGHRAMFRRFFGEESLNGFVLTPPEVTLAGTMTIRLGTKTIELVSAGETSHTGGDIFVFLPVERVVFAGDLLYNARLPLLSDGDTKGAMKAVDRLLSTGARVFVPGHGQPTDEDGARAYKGFLAALRIEVRMLRDSGAGKDEIVSKISLPEYSSWGMYGEWLGTDAGKVFDELSTERGARD